MYGEPALWHDLLDRLAGIALHLPAGAGRRRGGRGPAVRLVGGGAVPGRLPHLRRPAQRPGARRACASVPRVHFGVGTGELLADMAGAGADVVGVDWRVPLDAAAAPRGRPDGAGQPRPDRAAGAAGRARAQGPRRAAARARRARPRLQPRPRGPARDRPGRARPGRRHRPRMARARRRRWARRDRTGGAGRPPAGLGSPSSARASRAWRPPTSWPAGPTSRWSRRPARSAGSCAPAPSKASTWTRGRSRFWPAPPRPPSWLPSWAAGWWRPATTAAAVWVGGRLRPLPAGTFLGVPTRVVPVLRSRLLSPARPGAGGGRSGAARYPPARRPHGRRLRGGPARPPGGGPARRPASRRGLRRPRRRAVPARHRAPARRGRARAQPAARRPGAATHRPPPPTRPSSRPSTPAWVPSPARLARAGGARILLNHPVTGLERTEQGWRLRTGTGRGPGGGTAQLAAGRGRRRAGPARRARRPAAAAHAPRGQRPLSGRSPTPRSPWPPSSIGTWPCRRAVASWFRPSEGRLLKGATFASSKWAHLARPGLSVVRCSAGRSGEARVAAAPRPRAARRPRGGVRGSHGRARPRLSPPGSPAGAARCRSTGPDTPDVVAAVRESLPRGSGAGRRRAGRGGHPRLHPQRTADRRRGA